MDLTQIGKYKIEGFLGQGAMGHVYKAHDAVLNRHVAIKTITAALAGDKELQKRFHREAQAAARLNHPNIITVYDYGEEGETIYIAMELLEGTDLKEFLSSGSLKSLGAKLRIMAQICEGLAFAHSKGVIHRDLKPANIHVTMSGQVKIMDFGLARLDSGDRSKAGVVVGTPNYMSPEQVMGDEVDARTDIFSAGAVFYELLSNKKPFDADSVHGILFQVVHKQPTPVREISRELPPIVAEVVEKALAKDRANRFQSATEFREALTYIEHALASGRPQEARLSKGSDKTLLPSPPVAPRPSGAPSSAVVDGTVALDMKRDLTPVPRPVAAARDRSKPPSRASTPRLTRPAPAPHRPSNVGALVVLGLVLAAGGGAVYYFRHGVAIPIVGEAPSSSSGTSAAERALKQALVRTKVELAGEKLQDKDYRAAVAVASEALRLDPNNDQVKLLYAQAKERIDQLDAAAEQARTAARAGDAEKAGAALSRLLALDPRHPAALEVSSLLNSSFRKQADDARHLAEDARKSAEKAGGTRGDTFGTAAGLVKEGDGQYKRGSFADAARTFLESRDAFDKARRSAVAAPAPQAPTAEAAVAAPTAAIVTQPPTAPPTQAASLPPSTFVARRAFSVGPSVVQSRSAGSGVAGFEGASVQKATDFRGDIAIDLQPSEIRAGDSYQIAATFTNTGRKVIRLREATLTFTVNGKAEKQSVTPDPAELPPQQTATLTQTGGVWDEGIETWSLQIAVASDKGDLCKREIKLR